jgi:hypothetical protein
MLKSAALLVSLSTPAPSSAYASASVETSLKQRYSTKLRSLMSGNSGTRSLTHSTSTQAQLHSATAVQGDWYMEHLAESGSCSTGTTAVSSGYRMGICAEDFQGSSNSTWTKYSCTEDSSTGDVVLSMTTYTDDACTAGASVQPSVTYSTTCSVGKAARCQDTNSYSADMAEYSNGGLFQSGYLSSAECNAGLESDVVVYAGAKGCDGDGTLYGPDSASIHLSSDCSGSAMLVVTYASVVVQQPKCTDLTEDTGGQSPGDLTYDNIAVSIMWSDDDGDDDAFCFHVESKIDYKGVEYTYEELKAGKEPECSIPHSPSSKGVVITTSCDNKTVRVTDTHLMATTKGFQLAYSLKAGDVLFGGYSNTDMCTVVSVEKEKTTQQYFGLNCVHSEVLASGLRASTFGDFHTLPSWYMTYVGGLVGTDAASSLGEYIAEWYFQKY